MTVPDAIRRELIILCSRRATRTAAFSTGRPTHWSPTEAYDLETGAPFTPDGAWLAVVEQLKAGVELHKISLTSPPNKSAYQFHFIDARGARIYVKLQIVSGQVIGRSFHEG